MSKFSGKKAGTATINKAGGQAYQESPKLEFVSILLTSFLKSEYYRSEEQTTQRVIDLMDAISDKKFLAKAAIYARNKFGMRSITHLVAGEIAKKVKGEEWTKFFFDKVIHRPDDMIEILAYYWKSFKNEPNPLRKGFAKAFTRFDDYQLGKYKKEGKTVSLVDVINVVHPAHSPILQSLIEGTLKAPETWETKMTKAGQKAKNDEEKDQFKKEVWVSLIKERKLGYFALLRNLRNIVEQAPEMVAEACMMLTDQKLIRKSLVLPFRFMAAYKELENISGSNLVLGAIGKALEISFQNVPKFDGKTLVVVDHSGSMGEGFDSNFMKGALFGVAMAKSNDADFMHFGDIAQYISFNPNDSTLTIAKGLDNLNKGNSGQLGAEVGHGTNFHAIFQQAQKKYDRIMIFSDMQGWIGYSTPTHDFNLYKKKYESSPKIYSFDLSGLGSLQLPEKDIFCLAGFSEKIFDIMKILETDKEALIHEIEKTEL